MGCDKQNCGCGPEDYTSEIVYDGLPFSNSQLAAIKPNCNGLNDLLELWGSILGGLLDNTLVLDIGAWDMDTNGQVLVPHGLTTAQFNSVESISALITDDANSLKTVLGVQGNAACNGSVSMDATNVILDRTAGDFFDAAAFSGAVSNRGKIVIKYTK